MRLFLVEQYICEPRLKATGINTPLLNCVRRCRQNRGKNEQPEGPIPVWTAPFDGRTGIARDGGGKMSGYQSYNEVWSAEILDGELGEGGWWKAEEKGGRDGCRETAAELGEEGRGSVLSSIRRECTQRDWRASGGMGVMRSS